MEKIQMLTTPDEIKTFLVKTNEESYNWQKLAEELFELGEVVMKKINKQGTPKEPSMEKIIEEMGDVLLRINILEEKHDLEFHLMDRIDEKLLKLGEYINKNKYIGRL
jgi:NTP pyrophosphatase (non-canonical NTP hydrolase)